jgi:outer membrane biosynthesis protein TonB
VKRFVARNEDGEFELVLGNRQLLSVFFIVVVLLGVFFTMGYIVGRNSAPVVAEVQRKAEAPPVVDATPAAEPAPAASPKEDSSPTRTAQQLPADTSASSASETKKEPESKPAPSETPKSAKVDPEAARIKAEEAKRARATPGEQPASGQAYLQLAATSKREADVMVDVLRQKGFKALAAEIAEKPGTFRVLVGPVADGTTNGVRADLQKSGFPGNAAIRRTF